MVLADHQIKKLCKQPEAAAAGQGLFDWNLPLVEPFIEDNVQPASIDLTLGNAFIVFYTHNMPRIVDLNDPKTFEDLGERVECSTDESFTIGPGSFVLGVTAEKINCPPFLVGRLEGKSSLARLGLSIHATGGFIDPGFCGNVTLEMTNDLPVPIAMSPGRLIAQMSFEYMSNMPQHSYQGRYQGDETVVASRYGKELVK